MTPAQDATGLADELAKWLHDETNHPESYPSHTWPETERDDGQREGGFVKIVPLHSQEYFRDIARRLIARFAALRATSQTPDAPWRPIETAPLDGTEILLLTIIGVTQARFAPGEWHEHQEGREYDGPVWVCCDDQWQIEIEDCGKDGMHHGMASHWMPLSTPSASAGPQAEAAEISAVHSALCSANIPYCAFSSDGVNLIGNTDSIKAAARAFHSHSQIDHLKTQIRHWREECGKLHAKLAQPQPR